MDTAWSNDHLSRLQSTSIILCIRIDLLLHLQKLWCGQHYLCSVPQAEKQNIGVGGTRCDRLVGLGAIRAQSASSCVEKKVDLQIQPKLYLHDIRIVLTVLASLRTLHGCLLAIVLSLETFIGTSFVRIFIYSSTFVLVFVIGRLPRHLCCDKSSHLSSIFLAARFTRSAEMAPRTQLKRGRV